MKEALTRLVQAVRLERDAFVWMDFNDRATADALIFVAVTRLLILVGLGWSFFGLTTSLSGIEVLVSSILNALIFWLAYSGIAYAITKFLLNGSGNFAMFLRITGFAYPTLLVLIFTAQLGLPSWAALILGFVWFIAIVTRGIVYEGDLPNEKAVLAAIGGYVGWVIISSILGRGGI